MRRSGYCAPSRSSRSFRASPRYTCWASCAVGGVAVHEHPDHPRQRARDRDLAGAQQRHPAEADVPGGDRRELGVEVLGEREDAAHEVVGLEPVALESSRISSSVAARIASASLAVDGGGAAEREEPHGRAASASRAGAAQLLDLGAPSAAGGAPSASSPSRSGPKRDALERQHRVADRLDIRRTWRLRPSWMRELEHVGREPRDPRRRRAPVVELDALAQRAQRAARARARRGPSRGRSCGTSKRGCVSRWASSPSSVSRIRPVVSASRRPTGYSRARRCGTSVDDRRAAVGVVGRARRRRAAC